MLLEPELLPALVPVLLEPALFPDLVPELPAAFPVLALLFPAAAVDEAAPAVEVRVTVTVVGAYKSHQTILINQNGNWPNVQHNLQLAL